MCTSYCPCWTGQTKDQPAMQSVIEQDLANPYAISVARNYALWQGYMGADERTLNKYNRTRYSIPRITNDAGESVYWAPFEWSEFKFDSDGNQISYSSYKECLDAVLIP